MLNFLKDNGMHIYRLKGILSIYGYNEQFVAQGVHMIFDGHRGQPWGDSIRTSRLVFIGENLRKKQLETEFLSCCVDQSTSQSPPPTTTAITTTAKQSTRQQSFIVFIVCQLSPNKVNSLYLTLLTFNKKDGKIASYRFLISEKCYCHRFLDLP